jgi:NodT family efflux transporter outer membrane factor (OMF) lipoprotein
MVSTARRATPVQFAQAAAKALLCIGVSSCMVGPNFKTPQASVAPQWTQSGAAVHTSNETYAAWWTVFGDAELDRLAQTAYAQNLTLLAAGTRVLQARAQLGVAIGEFYPQQQQIGAGVDYNQATQTGPASIPGSSLRNYWSASLSSQVSWELDFWGKFRRGVESADAAYLASIASYDDVLVTLLGDVATTYIGIRTLQTQIAIAEDNVAKQKQALAVARARFEGGAATGLDVEQAENVLAQTEATIPQLNQQLTQGVTALCVLLGIPPEQLHDVLGGQAVIPVPPPEAAIGMPVDLLRRRPDIRAAELQAAAQSAQIGVAKADLYPAFTLSGAFGTLAASSGRNKIIDVFHADAIEFAFGPSFTWPIFNYGQITNTVRIQDARLQELLVDYKNTVLNAQAQVENGLAAYLQGADAVADLKRSVTAAAAALRIALDQYRLGTRDFTAVLVAEQNLYQAQNALAAAEGAYATGLANLYRALGGGWQIRQGHDFIDNATRAEMRSRTNWGRLLPPAASPQPQTPGLPSPQDQGPTVRSPQW